MIALPVLSLVVTLGCTSSQGSHQPDGASAARIEESTPEAFGVLGLLNDVSTTESLLDDEVGLDSRAARSLIAHRDGPDALYQTPDDDRFDTIAEVDAQYYVGDSALSRLLAWAEASGFVPDGDDVVGSWEGVSFTADQVGWTLELANTASFEALDEEVGLDSRAAEGIVAARPFADIGSLAEAYYVGGSALTDLRDHASDAQLSGPWGSCETSADCQEGLVCMGELAWGTGIQCVDDSMYGTFVSDTAVSIPDSGATVSSTITVSGLATVPVDVVVTLDIDHDRPADLEVTIDNFNGYSETLWSNESDPEGSMVVRAFPSDDMVNGDYSIHITDTVTGEAGVLRGWELYIVSNWD